MEQPNERPEYITCPNCGNKAVFSHVDDAKHAFYKCEKCGKWSLLPEKTGDNEERGQLFGLTLAPEEYVERIIAERKESGAELTHAELADMIMLLHYFKTLDDTEEVLVYQNGVYRPGGEALIKAEVERIMERAGQKENCKSNLVKEVIGHIQRSTLTPRSEFDNSKEILNLRNGLLNITTLELKPHSPDYLSLVQLPVRYDPNAKCPRIEQFFREVVREEDIPVLEEIIGYCLLRDHHIHKAFALLGDGANGKSTFLRLLEALLGKENCASRSLFDIENKRFAAADLYGKLANTYADLPPGALKGTAMFKMLTGGDLITAEKKFKPSFTFYNYAKLIFSANRLPEVEDPSGAFFRRWIIINFPNKFEGEREDKRILEKLTTSEELSGLLNIALRALKRLLENGGFTNSKSTEEIREDWILKSDPIGAFVRCCLETDPEGEVTKDECYNAFVEFCNMLKLPAVDKTVFAMRLQKYVTVLAVRLRRGEERITAWRGIRLKPKENWSLELE